MILKINKISHSAIIPNYAHKGDAGLDLYASEMSTIGPGKVGCVKTGVAIELPEGTEAQVRPRSGLAINNGITVLNSPGTIDEGYRGEITVILINHSGKTFEVLPGMKIAQMVVKPVLSVDIEVVDNLSSTTRGERGFGSTGC